MKVPHYSKHSVRMETETPAAPCPRALPVTLAHAVEQKFCCSEMKITSPGQLGSTSFPSPSTSDIQGPALAERAKLKSGRSGLPGQTAMHCSSPLSKVLQPCRPQGTTQWQKSSVLHRICQGWRGQTALGLALCQALQEGGGSILGLLQNPASAGSVSAPEVGRGTGTPAICRLDARRDGTSRARRVLPAPLPHRQVLAARPGLGHPGAARPRVARQGCAPHSLPPLSRRETQSTLHEKQRKGLCPGRSGASGHHSFYFPSPASGGETRMGTTGSPRKPEEARGPAPVGVRGAWIVQMQFGGGKRSQYDGTPCANSQKLECGSVGVG